MLRFYPHFSCRHCRLIGHLRIEHRSIQLGHYSLYYLLTLLQLLSRKVGSTRGDVKSSLLTMLSARVIFARQVLPRLHVTTWSKPISIHQPGMAEQNAPSIEKLEKESPAAEGTIPLSAPAPKPQESTVSESIPTASSSSPSSSVLKVNPVSDKPGSWKELSQYDMDVVKQRIRDRMNQTAVDLRQRADGFTAETKTKFSKLGAELNKVSGYEEIEALKKEVVEQGMSFWGNFKTVVRTIDIHFFFDEENKIRLTREAAKQAKVAYEQAVMQRSNSQREVNELIQRKHTWNEADIARFTEIVRQDHIHEQEETRAKVAFDETEVAVEREFSLLLKSILARYHEEQIWSDKIRSASTYGSLAALGLNLVVFILAIMVVEPWKRRRLAQTFEEKIEEMTVESKERMEGSLREIGEKFIQQEHLLSQVLQEVSGVKDLRKDIVGMQRPVEENTTPVPQVSIVEVPGTIPDHKYVSILGVPVSLPQRTFELAAVGVGAFVLGIVASVLVEI